MKRLAWYLASVLLMSPAVRAQHEQHEHHGIAHQTAAGVKLEVKDDAAAQVMTVRLGPLNLPAHSDHRSVAQAPDLYLPVVSEIWLLAYHPHLVDAAGNSIPGRLLHHVAFWNTRRSDFLCPNKEEHIFGAGGEMNDWPGVPGYGYRLMPGDRVRIETMFHNPTDTDYPQVYLEVGMERRTARAGEARPPAIRSVYPAWVDVQTCKDSGYDLRPGQSAATGEVTLHFSGVLLGVGGHLHDFGQGLLLYNVTRQEEVAALRSQLDAQGRIASIPLVTFFDRGGYRLSQGERLRVSATYDNPTGKILPDGAMGIVVGYFLPDQDAQFEALRRPERHADK